MRRSAAPSFRQNPMIKPFGSTSSTVLLGSNSTSSVNSNQQAKLSENTSDLPLRPSNLNIPSTCVPAVRSTASVLNLLSKVGKSSETVEASNSNDNATSVEDQGQKDTNTAKEGKNLTAGNSHQSSVNEDSLPGKRLFQVVWGKPSTKKHKTWEGDGTLEVGEKSATLKDEDGKILGRASQIKTAELQEGSRLKVGSKEVELIDLLSSPSETRAASSSVKRQAEEPPCNSSWKQVKKPAKNSFKFTTESCESFVMPAPSHDHQWEFNTKKLPVKPVVVDNFLTRVLRPHQKEGVVFMYECVMGMRNTQYRGAILADEMGLGKTLQTITLIWTLLRQGPYGGHPVVRRVLVVSPSSLVLNWQNEFNRWLGKHRLQTFVVDQKNKVTDFVRFSHVPIMLVSYEMLIRNFEDISKIRFDLMVCDEGHRLKNNNIRTSMLLNQLDVAARILLTGTPIQNDLQEFYALVSFVMPGILGSLQDFRKYFEGPILASQQPDCSAEEHSIGEERAQELNSKISCFILRRTQSVINKYLPTKTEAVLFVKPTQIQKILYKATLDWWENQPSGMGEVSSHFGVITALKKICNHPALIRCVEVVGDESNCDDSMPHDGLLRDLSSIFNTYEAGAVAVHHSGKLTLVRQLLEQLVFLRERIVLVSYFTQTLDILAALCDEMGLCYSRLDGSTPSSQRTTIVSQFNAPYSKHSVFLLSARAGGMGLNLTGASRLVLYDSDWNPASDAQAMSRVWRDGQKHGVFIYRLLTCGSIEEKIFQRQLSKVGLSGAVVDPQKKSNIKLSLEELKDLFTFHDGEECLTHASLGCSCDGDGRVPSGESLPLGLNNEEKENDDRDCKLFVGIPYQNVSQSDSVELRMNQLFKWEHHSSPINEKTLQTLGLSRSSKLLTFMFVAPLPMSA